MAQLTLGDITVDIERKSIKHAYLSVHPPSGHVRISAPKRMDLDAVRLFALSKLGWIRAQQRRMVEQPRETPRDYLERESHYVWGKRYLLEIHESGSAPRIDLAHSTLRLWVRPDTARAKREVLIARWYRELVSQAAAPLIEAWQAKLDVEVSSCTVRQMKTRWGSCTPAQRSIRLNTELAKKPPICLEYVVLHELAHLLEPSHNYRFIGLLDVHMPNWRAHREELNRLPITFDRGVPEHDAKAY